MKNVSGIYVIVNTKNGKVYVGKSKDIRGRWQSHINDLNANRHANRHLQAAWNKYGATVFRFQKLEYCSIEQLDEREQHFIKLYSEKSMSYNIVNAVNSTPHEFLQKAESEEIIHKARRARYEQKTDIRETKLYQLLKNVIDHVDITMFVQNGHDIAQVIVNLGDGTFFGGYIDIDVCTVTDNFFTLLYEAKRFIGIQESKPKVIKMQRNLI